MEKKQKIVPISEELEKQRKGISKLSFSKSWLIVYMGIVLQQKHFF